MKSMQRSSLPGGLSFRPFLEKAAVSIHCPDRRSDQIRRSRTRGIVESFFAILLIRPYRCEECDYRFFRWSIRHQLKAARSASSSDARDCTLLTPREASHGCHTTHADMD